MCEIEEIPIESLLYNQGGWRLCIGARLGSPRCTRSGPTPERPWIDVRTNGDVSSGVSHHCSFTSTRKVRRNTKRIYFPSTPITTNHAAPLYTTSTPPDCTANFQLEFLQFPTQPAASLLLTHSTKIYQYWGLTKSAMVWGSLTSWSTITRPLALAHAGSRSLSKGNVAIG